MREEYSCIVFLRYLFSCEIHFSVEAFLSVFFGMISPNQDDGNDDVT